MGVCIGGKKLVITIEPKTIRFDLPEDKSIIDINSKHEIDSIIKILS